MYGIQNEALLPCIDGWQDDIFADYGGSDRKCGVISPDGRRYLVKYAETHTRKNELDTSYVNNVLAEYLSSHVLSILGYPVHDTFLASYQDELVVCCENFTSEKEKLIEFGRFMRKHYDSGEIGRIPDVEQIRYVFRTDRLLASYRDLFWVSYWERFIGDALTGNFDRHMGNFGYLVSTEGVKPSPVYDNGSTLFPALSEHGMEEMLSEPEEILKRVLLFPKAALMINGTKVRYYDLLTSDYIPELSMAVRKKSRNITEKMPEVCRFINEQKCLSAVRKRFYNTILRARYEFILEPACECCAAENYSRDSLERLISGAEYTESMFKRDYSIICKNPDFEKRWRKVTETEY